MVLNLCLKFLIPTSDRLKHALRDLDDAGGPENRDAVGCPMFFFLSDTHMGVSKNRVPQNGWFIMENPIQNG